MLNEKCTAALTVATVVTPVPVSVLSVSLQRAKIYGQSESSCNVNIVQFEHGGMHGEKVYKPHLFLPRLRSTQPHLTSPRLTATAPQQLITTSYKHTKRSIMTCIGKKGTGENEGRKLDHTLELTEGKCRGSYHHPDGRYKCDFCKRPMPI